jgi:anti-sigma B factor antagonist
VSAATLPRHQEEGMALMSCPRCGLTVPLRARFLRLSHCPRCLAGAHIAVPMFVKEDGENYVVDGVAEGELVIGVKHRTGTVVLVLHGELDLASAPALQQQLEAAAATGVRRILVDLSDLHFIDSTGLQVLLYADRRLREEGRELLLTPGPRGVQRLFELTRTDVILRFVESE